MNRKIWTQQQLEDTAKEVRRVGNFETIVFSLMIGTCSLLIGYMIGLNV